MKREFKNTWMVLALSALAMLVSCTNNDDATNSTKGSLKVLLTDAPFPSDLVAEANVTIDEVSIKKSDDPSTEADESGFMILSSETKTFNLLDLQNGTVATLVETPEIEMGTYSEIRLHIVSAEIVLKSGETFDLTIPSGTSSGLKVKIDGGLVIRGGNPSALILDFDVSRSFLVQGNPDKTGKLGGFKFKPVIRATAEDVSGTIDGHVFAIEKSITDEDSTAYKANVTVGIVMNEDTIKAITDANGYYAVIGLLPGSYEVFSMPEGYDKFSAMADVHTDEVTTVDIQLNLTPAPVVVTP